MTRLDEYKEILERCKMSLDQEVGDHPLKPVMLKAIIDYAEQCYHAEMICKGREVRHDNK